MWHRSAAVAVCSAIALSVGASATPAEPSVATAFLGKGSSEVHCQEGMSDVRKVCSIDRCTVLAGNMMHRSCRDYCDKQGLQCEDAWDNEADRCVARDGAHYGCDYSGGVADLLCICKPGFKTRLERFTKFDRLNCFAAKGAYEEDKDGKKKTEEECARFCDDDPKCEGFVHTKGCGGHCDNLCYRRSSVDLLLCEEAGEGQAFQPTFYLKNRMT